MEASASALVNAPASALGAGLPAQRPTLPASQANGTAQAVAVPGMASEDEPNAALAAQVGELNELLKGTWVSLRIDIDKESRHVVTTVVDRDTGEVIRQIPSEEFLRVSRAMNKLQGLLVSQKA